jgi:hypothetical protein
MAKKVHSPKHHPGELARLTSLIERKAKEIAEVLLWDVADAEQSAEDPKRQAFFPKGGKLPARGSTAKPNKRRELKREQRVDASRRSSSWHG